MNRQTVIYWVVTGLFVAAMAGGGVADVMRVTSMKEAMANLGYPEYLLTILGVAKLLGVVAILLPRWPLLKEWAYAGFTFDLLGATASHGLNGDGISEILPPLVLFGLAAASYFLRPASRKLDRINSAPS